MTKKIELLSLKPAKETMRALIRYLISFCIWKSLVFLIKHTGKDFDQTGYFVDAHIHICGFCRHRFCHPASETVISENEVFEECLCCIHHYYQVWCQVCVGPLHLSRVVRKTEFCISQNEDADQLRGNRKADQRLCFRFIDTTIPVLSESKISSL